MQDVQQQPGRCRSEFDFFESWSGTGPVDHGLVCDLLNWMLRLIQFHQQTTSCGVQLLCCGVRLLARMSKYSAVVFEYSAVVTDYLVVVIDYSTAHVQVLAS